MATDRTLRIAQIAPLWAAVPPREYGGAELMVSWLTEQLVSEGHAVTLFASGDSSTAATLQPVCERNLIDTMRDGEAYQYEGYSNAAAARALQAASEFDVIHCHLGAASIPLLSQCGTPVVHTVHAGLDSVDEFWLLRSFPDEPLAAISNSQVAEVPTERHAGIRTIYHGCDFSQYELCESADNYLAFIGRMGPNKNPVSAIKIAAAADMPIVLAGQPQNASESKYFERQVRPLIDGQQVVYLGPVDHAGKVRLLQQAAALLFPITWDEHFGLVMIEAMACGTPVIANRRGSVPEVIEHGVTGFFSSAEDDLASFVPRAMALDRRAIRDRAYERFSHVRMTNDYLRLYCDLIDGCPVGHGT